MPPIEEGAAGRPRTRLTNDQRRRQLVGIGLRMLADRPLDGLRVDDVARAAGISRGLLFYYFPSKRAFFLAVVRAAADRVLKAMEAPPGGPPERRLRTVLTEYIDLVDRRREAYFVLWRGAAGSDPDVAEIYAEARDAMVSRVLVTLGRMVDDPRARLLAGGWLSMTEDAAIDWARDKPIGRDELVDSLVAALHAALAPAET